MLVAGGVSRGVAVAASTPPLDVAVGSTVPVAVGVGVGAGVGEADGLAEGVGVGTDDGAAEADGFGDGDGDGFGVGDGVGQARLTTLAVVVGVGAAAPLARMMLASKGPTGRPSGVEPHLIILKVTEKNAASTPALLMAVPRLEAATVDSLPAASAADMTEASDRATGLIGAAPKPVAA